MTGTAARREIDRLAEAGALEPHHVQAASAFLRLRRWCGPEGIQVSWRARPVGEDFVEAKRRHAAAVRVAAFDVPLLDRTLADNSPPAAAEIARLRAALDRVAAALGVAGVRTPRASSPRLQPPEPPA